MRHTVWSMTTPPLAPSSAYEAFLSPPPSLLCVLPSPRSAILHFALFLTTIIKPTLQTGSSVGVDHGSIISSNPCSTPHRLTGPDSPSDPRARLVTFNTSSCAIYLTGRYGIAQCFSRNVLTEPEFEGSFFMPLNFLITSSKTLLTPSIFSSSSLRPITCNPTCSSRDAISVLWFSHKDLL
ncbi:hypothetical protein B0J13DRAFT_562899, partial [Dactylonectria estremocensis]